MDKNCKNIAIEKVELHGTLAEFRQALEEEIDAIKAGGQSSTLLTCGSPMGRHGDRFWYKYQVEYAPEMPADTPCKLIMENNSFNVTVVSFEEGTIILASENSLPANFSRARLENGSTVLMENLIKCIEENAETENPAGLRMLPFNGEAPMPYHAISQIKNITDSKLNDAQRDAVVSALSNDITYIWGPPGTGKTQVIGSIIYELYLKNRSVLVVSHTNTAVDGAIQRACERIGKSEGNKQHHPDDAEVFPILRIGNPVKELPEEVKMEAHTKSLGKDLFRQKEILEKEQTGIRTAMATTEVRGARCKWVQTTRMPELGGMFQKVINAEREIDKLHDKVWGLDEEVERQRRAHPEYEEYYALSQKFEKVQASYQAAHKKFSSAQEEVLQLPDQIQNAGDEQKKHAIYAELIEKKGKCLSKQFLNKGISDAETKQKNLQAEISELERKEQEFEKVVAEYEGKGRLARLFLDKTAYQQALGRLQAIPEELDELEAAIATQKNLAQDFRRQLEELQLLDAQIQAVFPTFDVKFWAKQESMLAKRLDVLKKELPTLRDEDALLEKNASELQQKIGRISKTCEDIQIKEKELIEKRGELKKKEEAQRKLLQECKTIIDSECEQCPDSVDCTMQLGLTVKAEEKALRVVYKTLKERLTIAKNEATKTDVETLRAEYLALKKELGANIRELESVNAALAELERQAIMQAKVVGATLTKTYLSTHLRERSFDTVILDEASMASIPALWCAAYLAGKNVVIVGDFLQLPPIVIAGKKEMAQKWLGKDIFYHSGIQDRARKGNQAPQNFVMLNCQYRMESEIADVANELYYGQYTELTTAPDNDFRKDERNTFESWYGPLVGHRVHMIDTENLHAWVTGVPKGRSHSRLNCFSASVSVNLAFKCIEKRLNEYLKGGKPPKEPLVLIVAPYKPHVELVNQMIKAEYARRGIKGDDMNFIRAGTIHSFQGSEADIVIFDLVIDEPHWRANLFMPMEEVNEDLKKMFNVAITRAKFQLFMVGDFSYCMKKAKDNALGQLLSLLLGKKQLPKEDAKEIFPTLTYTPPTVRSTNEAIIRENIICKDESFYDYFLHDINTFRTRLIIYSPFITENRLTKLLPAFTDATKLGREIIVVTKAISERKRSELAQYTACEKALVNQGVKIIHKHGMHEKLIFVDDQAVWIGSLNALSFTGNTGEVMERRASRELVKVYEKMYDIPHISQAIHSEYELRCPICQGEMLVKESDGGGIYWECVNKDYARSAEQRYPVNGMMTCHCGGEYMFAMKKEPRWVCKNNSKHYQKIREGDLKLEGMKALIPPKTLPAVKKYFEDKRKDRNSNA